MPGMFDWGGGPRAKTVKPPPLPAPAAIPEVGPEAGETAIKKARRRRGYAKTIVTGALEPPARKKTVLG